MLIKKTLKADSLVALDELQVSTIESLDYYKTRHYTKDMSILVTRDDESLELFVRILKLNESVN